jgi:putative colanic acid biosynthesis acetyltransferase WcaF
MKEKKTGVRRTGKRPSPADAGGRVHLARSANPDLDRGAGRIREGLWLIIRLFLFELWPFRLYGCKRWVLRRFGARIGRNPVIKPGVKITFPWKLEIGDDALLGEDAWLLNLAPVRLGDDVCISQGAMICTGNHDYTSPEFRLRAEPIEIETGAWIAARAFVGPGVRVGSHAVLTAGSVASADLEPYGVYTGNPARRTRRREIREPSAD